jgi:hypothetical protein
MQIDWATHGLMRIGDCMPKPHDFAAVLCYSRFLFVEFFPNPSRYDLSLSRSRERITSAIEKLWRKPWKKSVDATETRDASWRC